MQYRRLRQAGGCYFFTVNLADRKQQLLTDHINLLREVVAKVKRKHPFHIEAMVVLPDHLHTLWSLPEGDADFAKRWRLIKVAFSKELPDNGIVSPSRQRKGERGIWQRRYWEHLIRDERDFRNHVDYIHFNPVKHGHVKRCCDWPYSSFHRYVRAGILPSDWGVAEQTDCANGFGERCF